MRSGYLLFIFAFAGLAASPDTTQVQGHLLDRNQYLCSNCFFGANTYYYCFEAADRILIGYQKTPTLNWKDESANDLTRLHKSWKPLTAEGENISLRYNDKNIWVTRADGKTVKLRQDYSTDIFVNNSRCRSVVKKQSE
jgi:hypothetical protein